MIRNNVKTYKCYWSCQRKYFKKIQNDFNSSSIFFSPAFSSLAKTSSKIFLHPNGSRDRS